MAEATINATFKASVEAQGSKAALSRKVDGTYQDISYDELGGQVKEFALGLMQLGVGKGDRVGLLSENCPEWAITDLATVGIGAVDVPMFPTLTSAQVEYILRDSSAKLICVSNAKQLEKVQAFIENVSSLEQVVVFDGEDVELSDSIHTFDAVREMGRAVENGDQVYGESSEGVNPRRCRNDHLYLWNDG